MGRQGCPPALHLVSSWPLLRLAQLIYRAACQGCQTGHLSLVALRHFLHRSNASYFLRAEEDGILCAPRLLQDLRQAPRHLFQAFYYVSQGVGASVSTGPPPPNSQSGVYEHPRPFCRADEVSLCRRVCVWAVRRFLRHRLSHPAELHVVLALSRNSHVARVLYLFGPTGTATFCRLSHSFEVRGEGEGGGEGGPPITAAATDHP